MSSKLIHQVIAPIFAFGTVALTICTPATSHATIVEFQTSQGNFEVNLYDQSTPATVTNFLAYVEDGSYIDSVIHRSVDNFVIQGGGFSFEGTLPLSAIATKSPVNNEPVWSNVTATIAMAKVGGSPNSATNQWFFNLKDNSGNRDNGANLDVQNGGFTAFGQVIGDGMTVVNKIAGLTTCGDTPMVEGYPCDINTVPGHQDFVTVYSVEVIDPSANTAEPLTKVKNTLLVDNAPAKKISSGGSLAWLSLLSLGLLSWRRKYSN